MRAALSVGATLVLTAMLVATSEAESPQPSPASDAGSASETSLREVFPDAAAFRAAHAARGDDPVAVVTLWLNAARLAAEPDTADTGRAGLTVLTVDGVKDADWLTRSSNTTFERRLTSHPHVFRSYFEGAEPDNAYAVAEGAAPRIARSEARGEDWLVALDSSGADSPRSLTLVRGKDGRWYVHRFANVYVDVRPVADPNAPF